VPHPLLLSRSVHPKPRARQLCGTMESHLCGTCVLYMNPQIGLYQSWGGGQQHWGKERWRGGGQVDRSVLQCTPLWYHAVLNSSGAISGNEGWLP
jgi:hypothetical protein